MGSFSAKARREKNKISGLRGFALWVWKSISSFSWSSKPPLVHDETRLVELLSYYPNFSLYLSEELKVNVVACDRSLTFREFAERYSLPPPRLLFMNYQLLGRFKGLRRVTPRRLADALRDNPATKLIDVREPWERKLGSIPGAVTLSESVWNSLLADPQTPVILYCHFGIRSMDAALRLHENGVKDVATLEGGIDAWSAEVDATVPRYTGAWC